MKLFIFIIRKKKLLFFITRGMCLFVGGISYVLYVRGGCVWGYVSISVGRIVGLEERVSGSWE